MAESQQWEYRLQTLGSTLREPKDGEILALLNAWGVEGWELVSAVHTTGNKVTLIARRPLSESTRRRRSYPV